jgi:hypothetical protein
MICAGFAAVLVSIVVPIYLQLRAANEAARNQSVLVNKVQAYISERDASDRRGINWTRKFLAQCET